MSSSKNWLVLALAAALSFASSLPVQARSTATHSAAASAKAKDQGKSVRAAKASKRPARHVKAVVSSTSRRHLRKTRLSLGADALDRQALLMPVSVNAARTPSAKIIGDAPRLSAGAGTSFGQLYGLHQTQDPLDLKSSVALVMDQETNEIIFSKNSDAVLPIASLTKLMTAMVMVEARLPMDDMITVTEEDVDTEKNSSSRLAVGATLTRGELLHLALMSSENRAAHALGRTFPGGLQAFVGAMNAKALSLGMADTHYVDPTGLNSRNQSSAKDLAALVKAAYQQPLIRELSTSHEYAVRVGARQIQFRNTNSLVRNPAWDIGLQKTGYIVEAGRCLVMQAKMAGRKFIMVFLDSTGKYSRQADAERVRRWLETVQPKGAVGGIVQVKVTS